MCSKVATPLAALMERGFTAGTAVGQASKGLGTGTKHGTKKYWKRAPLQLSEARKQKIGNKKNRNSVAHFYVDWLFVSLSTSVFR